MGRQAKRTLAGAGLGPPGGRRGAATVELALCLPVLLILGLGTIETCNVIYVRTRMYSVAYEAARLATRPVTAAKASATSTDVTNRCTSLLSQVGVRGAQVQIQVQDYVTAQSKTLAAANAQDLVTVSISAPLSQNAVTMFVVSGSLAISAQATLIIE